MAEGQLSESAKNSLGILFPRPGLRSIAVWRSTTNLTFFAHTALLRNQFCPSFHLLRDPSFFSNAFSLRGSLQSPWFLSSFSRYGLVCPYTSKGIGREKNFGGLIPGWCHNSCLHTCFGEPSASEGSISDRTTFLKVGAQKFTRQFVGTKEFAAEGRESVTDFCSSETFFPFPFSFTTLHHVCQCSVLFTSYRPSR